MQTGISVTREKHAGQKTRLSREKKAYFSREAGVILTPTEWDSIIKSVAQALFSRLATGVDGRGSNGCG
jgi:hypothetical protein